MPEAEWKLTAVQFEELYASFRTSIGRELTSEDYLNLFGKARFPEFVQELNATATKYLRGDASGPSEKSDASVPREIPIADCIVTELDAEGNFNGFSIRPELANVAWMRGVGGVKFI